jgi:GNAT superfamily N-acetyltransferase
MADAPTRLRIRRARPEEARALTGLALASKAVWGYAEALREQFLTELTLTPDYVCRNPVFVVEEEGGGAPLALGALARIDDEVADLDLMFVAPGRLRRGIGTTLFAFLCDEARARGFRRLKIVSDPHAIGFYRRMGAVDAGAEESRSVPGRMLPVFAFALGAGQERP